MQPLLRCRTGPAPLSRGDKFIRASLSFHSDIIGCAKSLHVVGERLRGWV